LNLQALPTTLTAPSDAVLRRRLENGSQSASDTAIPAEVGSTAALPVSQNAAASESQLTRCFESVIKADPVKEQAVSRTLPEAYSSGSLPLQAQVQAGSVGCCSSQLDTEMIDLDSKMLPDETPVSTVGKARRSRTSRRSSCKRNSRKESSSKTKSDLDCVSQLNRSSDTTVKVGSVVTLPVAQSTPSESQLTRPPETSADLSLVMAPCLSPPDTEVNFGSPMTLPDAQSASSESQLTRCSATSAELGFITALYSPSESQLTSSPDAKINLSSVATLPVAQSTPSESQITRYSATSAELGSVISLCSPSESQLTSPLDVEVNFGSVATLPSSPYKSQITRHLETSAELGLFTAPCSPSENQLTSPPDAEVNFGLVVTLPPVAQSTPYESQLTSPPDAEVKVGSVTSLSAAQSASSESQLIISSEYIIRSDQATEQAVSRTLPEVYSSETPLLQGEAQAGSVGCHSSQLVSDMIDLDSKMLSDETPVSTVGKARMSRTSRRSSRTSGSRKESLSKSKSDLDLVSQLKRSSDTTIKAGSVATLLDAQSAASESQLTSLPDSGVNFGSPMTLPDAQSASPESQLTRPPETSAELGFFTAVCAPSESQLTSPPDSEVNFGSVMTLLDAQSASSESRLTRCSANLVESGSVTSLHSPSDNQLTSAPDAEVNLGLVATLPVAQSTPFKSQLTSPPDAEVKVGSVAFLSAAQSASSESQLTRCSESIIKSDQVTEKAVSHTLPEVYSLESLPVRGEVQAGSVGCRSSQLDTEMIDLDSKLLPDETPVSTVGKARRSRTSRRSSHHCVSQRQSLSKSKNDLKGEAQADSVGCHSSQLDSEVIDLDSKMLSGETVASIATNESTSVDQRAHSVSQSINFLFVSYCKLVIQ